MYETIEQINQRLAREIKSGKQYDSLIPDSDCLKIKSGKGNTEYSVTQMVDVVKHYSHQTAKVAKKLKKSSLTSTLQSIQDFVYWHIQYKIDESDQLLRSPACSWASRYDGVDCKSYSIFVASILQQLGIKSYFRRVSYSPDKPYSHVYNVIPVEQKNGDLNHGYYIVDGTINTSIYNEPNFYKNSDMEIPIDLKHYTLAAPAQNSTLSKYEKMYLNQRGFESLEDFAKYLEKSKPNGLGALTVDSAINFFKNTNFTSFKNLITNFWQSLKNLSCWGGSAYKDSHIKTNLDIIKDMLNEDIKRINNYLADGDFVKMSDEISLTANKYTLMKKVVESNLSEGWDACSTAVQKKQIFIIENHVKAVTNALLEWAKASFVSKARAKSYTLTHPGHSGGYFMGQGKKMEMINSNATVTVFVPAKLSTMPYSRNLEYTGLKPGTKVTFFEATNEINKIFSNADSVSFNTATFLTELQNVATVFYNPAQPNNGSGNGGYDGANPGSGNQYNESGKTSGIKLAGGVLLTIAAIGLGASVFEKQKTTEK